MSSARPRWPFQTKLVVSLILLAFLVYLLFRFQIIIKPLVLAIILAYILNPVANFLRARLHLNRVLAILLTYLVLLGIVAAVPLILVPLLEPELAGINLDLQKILDQVNQFLGHRYTVAGQVIDLSALERQLASNLQGLLEPFLNQTLGLAVNVISSLVWVIFIVIVSFYLIKDNARIGEWLERVTPPAYRSDLANLLTEINLIWSAFFRGQLVLGLTVASIISLLGLILGLPFALGMGVLAGLLEFLPSVGHGIWLFIASLLAFFAGSTWLPLPNWAFMLILIGLHMVFQQFDLNYLIPRIIGRRVHLPPVVVILGIVAGAVWAGVLGILLAAPTIASTRVLVGYLYANLFDLEPFPPEESSTTLSPNPRWWRKTRKGETQ